MPVTPETYAWLTKCPDARRFHWLVVRYGPLTDWPVTEHSIGTLA